MVIPAPYTPETVCHLIACHGSERTALIINGADPTTNTDLTAWRNLGGDTALSMAKRNRMVRDCWKSGMTVEKAAAKCSVSVACARSIYRHENLKWL